MAPVYSIHLLDSNAPSWRDACAALIPANAPVDRTLHLPLHFCQVTLPRLHGGAYQLLDGGALTGYGYLLPRQRAVANRPVFTARHHTLPGAEAIADAELTALLREALSTDRESVYVSVYHPEAWHAFTETHSELGPVDIGRPSREEAARIPALHQRVWGSSADALYPADLASDEFGAGSALVARVEGEMVGFLLGFFKFGGSRLPESWAGELESDWRLESQIMGVRSEYRGLRIANLLKRVQAEQALEAGARIVNWTADPLQYPNAALNFGLLRAVAFDFYSDLYPFRNELNRVPASRFGLTWLVNSERVTGQPMIGGRAAITDLSLHDGIALANEGLQTLDFDRASEVIAIEIPADWTRLQAEDTALAQEWRSVTDALFARLVGLEAGKFVVTGVGILGDRRFLIAEAATPNLFARLAAS